MSSQVAESHVMVPNFLPVVERIQETSDVFTLKIDFKEDFRFFPGQFNMLYSFGVGEVPISICGNSGARSVLHTIRTVGTVTKSLEHLKVGDYVGVRGPYGTSWPVDLAAGKDVVIVAGGIGLAPLRPVILTLAQKKISARRVYLIVGARNPLDLLYQNEWKDWQQKNYFNQIVTVDQRTTDWTERVGVVTKYISGLDVDPQNSVAYICGPEIMMRFSASELMGLGLAKENIFVSLERNMKCAVGFCGHCQYGPEFICKDGPVFSYQRVEKSLYLKEC